MARIRIQSMTVSGGPKRFALEIDNGQRWMPLEAGFSSYEAAAARKRELVAGK